MKPSTSSPNALHKSPPFKILIGLTGALVFLSLFMYTQLEHISRDDDVLPGSGGGDGQAWDMRSATKKHHTRKKREKGLLDFAALLPGRKSMKEQIEDFADWKVYDKKRRTENGVLSTREEYERDHPYGSDEELQQKVQALRKPDLQVVKTDIPYDIYNCPDNPPPNYPFAWNVRLVLENWNPDNTDMPSQIYQGLCVLDWKKDYQKALNYREAELPFVIQHAPEVMKASLRWMHEIYMNDLLGDEPIRNEHSLNNHFMYWKTNHPVLNYHPPTDMTELTFADWYQHARELDGISAHDQISHEHWYFRLNAMFDKHGYVYEELPFFDPSLGTSMTMINPEDHRGINCRFGMKGITAETHFDSSSNFIALMGGQRRYILAHPNQCVQMELYPQQHPSGRHTSLEWAEFDFTKNTEDRPFLHANVNEVVMQAGDLMYLPTYWFHFIVSLNLNYQCNSRSGDSRDYEEDIASCGFTPATVSKRRKKH